MAKSYSDHASDAIEIMKVGAESSANAVYDLTSVATKKEDVIASSVQSGLQSVGSEFNKASIYTANISRAVSDSMYSKATSAAENVEQYISSPTQGRLRKATGRFAWGLTKVLMHASGLVADSVTALSDATNKIGDYVAEAAPGVAGAVGGAMKGVATSLSNGVDSVALSSDKIDAMRKELKSIGDVNIERSLIRKKLIEGCVAGNNRERLLDLLVVGGVTLATVLRSPEHIAPELQKAFELAYPVLAHSESFAHVVGRMSADKLVGLASGVKGKLFEINLVNHMNHGSLPPGYTAELAHSATQPGWDIQVLDDHGHVSELLQAKATESVSYVHAALDRYPDIDVTTTSEVHAHLVAMSTAEHVRDSGISDVALQAKVDAAIHGTSEFGIDDLVPSSLGLAVISLSVFMNTEMTLREKGAALGNRSTKAGLTSGVGKLVMLATQTWWLGLIAGVGSRWLAGVGEDKRTEYETLATALALLRIREPLSLTIGQATGSTSN